MCSRLEGSFAVPRYFFNVTDGRFAPDPIGTVLPDTYAAQAAAVRASGGMIREMGGGLGREAMDDGGGG